jgi:hypothetical protein
MGMEEKLVRKKLEVILREPAIIDAYLKEHGVKIDMRHVQEMKERFAKQQKSTVQAGASDDPTFQILVTCPGCGKKEITSHELKSKSLAVELDRYQVPRYQPTKGFKPLNYHLYAVTVCPQCFLASPDKRDFITFSVQTRSENKTQLSNYVLDEMRKRVDDRRKLLEGKDPDSVLSHPRSVDGAILSYRLALFRAKVEMGLESPLSFYKGGMYALRLAQFERDAGRDDEGWCQEAVKHLKTSYTRGELPNADMECQLLFIIVALQIRLQALTDAQSYIAVFDKQKGMKPEEFGEKGRPATLERWTELAKDLWTNREDPDIWNH